MNKKQLVHNNFILLNFLLLFVISCKKNEPCIVIEDNYAFFVAGHTYGSATQRQLGLHPPFVESTDFINNYCGVQLGFLTGDVLDTCTEAYLSAAKKNLEKFNVPIHIAAGNHDRCPVFLNYFQQYYYHFKHKNDLFIILSPTDWNIEGAQKDFLVQTLNTYKDSVTNIFIFCHELVWWSPTNKFKDIKINYVPHYPGSSNYWAEIHPILEGLTQNVVMFSGDLGASAQVDAYAYYKEKNITFIATGMGGGTQDNFIIVEVKNGVPSYRLMDLTGWSPSELVKLEDYQLK